MPLSRTKQTGSALPIVIGVIVLIMAVGLYVGMKSDGASDLEPFHTVPAHPRSPEHRDFVDLDGLK